MAGDDAPSPIDFEFALDVFRLSAIMKATYRFTGHFTVKIEPLSDSRVRVRLVPSSLRAVDSIDPATLPNEVLDQELREVVADETKSVRDLLLAQAFSGFSLVDPVGETADYKDDPLGITAEHLDSERSRHR